MSTTQDSMLGTGLGVCGGPEYAANFIDPARGRSPPR